MEIELKFLLGPQHIDRFKQLILNELFDIESKNSLFLTNAYFDTQSSELRRYDIGLRTRGSAFSDGTGWSEQTIKLAGQDIGGLHQRPEHTVRLSDSSTTTVFADLTKFSDVSWPAGFDPASIQPHLIKLFETSFNRDIWHVTMPTGTVIEMVLDQGNISANDASCEICEIEFELVSGSVTDIFNLAHWVASYLPIRLGTLSKAARGYMLVNDKPLKSYNLEAIPLSVNDNVETGLVRMLSGAISYIQHHETIFIEQNSLKALRRVIDGVSQLIHVFQLFSDILPNQTYDQLVRGFKNIRKSLSWVDIFYQFKQLTNRHSPYRKKIENSESLSLLLQQQLEHEKQMNDAVALFQSKQYNVLMLQLVEWLSRKQWRNDMSLQQIDRLSLSMQSTSAEWLDNAWSKLKPVLLDMQDVSQSSYIEKLYWPLATELLTGICVGNLYQQDDWLNFRNPLVDLLIGCEELMLLNSLAKLVDDNVANDETLESHLSWLDSKQQSLMMALSASTKNCSKLRPYW